MWSKYDSYSGCRRCNSKVVEASGTVVQCTKCSAFSKVAKARKISTATVIIEGSDGKEHQATVFDDIIQQIGSFSDQRDDDDIIEKLMNVDTMLEFTINKSNNIVTSVAVLAEHNCK